MEDESEASQLSKYNLTLLRGDAGDRGREDHPGHRVHAVGSEPERGLAQRLWDGGQGVLRQGGHRGDDHDAQDEPSGEHREGPDVHVQHALEKCRRDEGQGEIAIDDRRHAGQHLEHRFEDAAHLRRGVLGQIDRRAEAEGDRHEQRDESSTPCR